MLKKHAELRDGTVTALQFDEADVRKGEIALRFVHDAVRDMETFERTFVGPSEELRELGTEVAEFSGGVVLGWVLRHRLFDRHFGFLKLYGELSAVDAARYQDVRTSYMREVGGKRQWIDRIPKGARMYRELTVRTIHAFKPVPPDGVVPPAHLSAVHHFCSEAREALTAYRPEFYARRTKALLDQQPDANVLITAEPAL